jgi:hypothetical protein
MGEIRPVEHLPDAVESRKTPAREQEKTERTGGRDEVEISAEARRAAEVARLVEMTRDLPDETEDQVSAAKDNVESGHHKNEEVIKDTARRLLGG